MGDTGLFQTIQEQWCSCRGEILPADRGLDLEFWGLLRGYKENQSLEGRADASRRWRFLIVCLLCTGLLVGDLLTTKTGLAPKELDAPSQQEVVQRDLRPRSPLTVFLTCLVLEWWEGLGWRKVAGIRTQKSIQKSRLQLTVKAFPSPGVLSCQKASES